MEHTKLHVNMGAAQAVLVVCGDLEYVTNQLNEFPGTLFEMAPMIDANTIDRHYIGPLKEVWINSQHVAFALEMDYVIVPTENGGQHTR